MSKCGGIFLRQELENIKGRCVVHTPLAEVSNWLTAAVVSKSGEKEINSEGTNGGCSGRR
jgi:hypothetical protein